MPMLQRGVSLAFLHAILEALKELGRVDYDSGRFLNGGHTTNSKTDWQEFDRGRDPYSGKACTLHTGTSFVETCIAADLTHDKHGKAFFGPINVFVSYTWRGEGITLAKLVAAVVETLEREGVDPGEVFMFVDIFVCAQHRNERPESKTCPNATDVGKFKEVIQHCERLLLYCTPIKSPRTLTRVWCLYEMMEAMQMNIPVHVALGHADATTLESLILDSDERERLLQMFAAIKTQDAEATWEQDRVMVFKWIEEALGANCFEKMDELVRDGLRKWLLKMMVALAQKGLGEDDTELLGAIGLLSGEVGDFDQALKCHTRELSLKIERLGHDHPVVATTQVPQIHLFFKEKTCICVSRATSPSCSTSKASWPRHYRCIKKCSGSEWQHSALTTRTQP